MLPTTMMQETLADSGLGVLLEGSDPEVVAVNKALARFGQAIQPGAYLVARGDCKARCLRPVLIRLAYKRNSRTSWGVRGKMLPRVTAFMLGSLRWRPVGLGANENCADLHHPFAQCQISLALSLTALSGTSPERAIPVASRI
ncbi:hypothetical protein C8R48DRAFT_676379 [Suillus tomentosus]|nr:hypothetical protein C8R48DRAFT_676379 [Suillus tomentosus]